MIVGIVDYGMGNLRSIENKLAYFGQDFFCSSDAKKLAAADKLILPGVGHFARGMENLDKLGLTAFLDGFALKQKKPVLGICLGMQLFSEYSEEGNARGLGWIAGSTRKIAMENNGSRPRKVPHMGWNSLQEIKKSALFEGISPGDLFYFVHSYHICCQESQDVAAVTEYGMKLCAAVQKNNILGFQFHPEKSYDAGFKLIGNFLKA